MGADKSHLDHLVANNAAGTPLIEAEDASIIFLYNEAVDHSLLLVTDIMKQGHICSICGHRRSRTFHRKHPLKVGDQPIPGICRRCLPDSIGTLVINIHHHYAPNLKKEIPTDEWTVESYSRVSEAPAEHPVPPYPELSAESPEDSPPPARYDRKPRGTRWSKFKFSNSEGSLVV